jgi:hypothetical protein
MRPVESTYGILRTSIRVKRKSERKTFGSTFANFSRSGFLLTRLLFQLVSTQNHHRTPLHRLHLTWRAMPLCAVPQLLSSTDNGLGRTWSGNGTGRGGKDGRPVRVPPHAPQEEFAIADPFLRHFQPMRKVRSSFTTS